ncbi:MAG: MBL fold metallo-hydrolase [Chloroflexia bacterium]|nr:MBL fold metallo-hydrolase [Chloroflexia bacterium]
MMPSNAQNLTVHAIPLPMSTCFLLEGLERLTLIDTGPPWVQNRIYRELRSLGYEPRDLDLVVITHMHPDHCGCLEALLEDTGAKLAAHPLARELRGRPVKLPRARELRGIVMDAVYKPIIPFLKYPDVPVDYPLEDGAGLEALGLPATALHTPGHTRDSLSLLFADGRAFTGDLLIPVRGRLKPQPYFIEDETALRASIERIKAHQPRLIYSSHWPQPQEPPWD